MTKLIIANWKSNHTLFSALNWVDQVNNYIETAESDIAELTKPVLVPPAPFLGLLSEKVKNSILQLGTQDLSPYPAGSYTGEVCTDNLQDLNIDYAVLGHSERRRYFGEIDEMVADKVKQAVRAGITPIICVDEPYLESQTQALKDIDVDITKEEMIVAYEPLAAIGSGNNADVKQVKTVVDDIKEIYQQSLVIYGGSVTADNVEHYLAVADGVLVGGASLKAEDFIQLLQAAC